MGSFVSVTPEEEREMLRKIGADRLSDLFSGIPEELKLRKELSLPDGVSEMEAEKIVRKMAGKNHVFQSVFRGAGAYRHYIPAIVNEVISKESFLTAYTPYQAEISQGILQSIFEYQTYICELTGMDVSNACVYDGAEAAAEAAAMCREKNRNVMLVSETANPFVISVIRTYCFGNGMEVRLIPEKNYRTDTEALKGMVNGETAGVYLQNPDYYGSLEDVSAVGKITHDAGAKLILGVNPIASAVLKTAGEYKADIATGEGQPLGMPLSFGGPYLGFMAASKENMRKLPGRIVGETHDANGKTGYVLTLQAREQHIRREKAGSNICSNEALCALCAGVYCSAMGPEGIRKAARSSVSKAHYLSDKLSEIGFERTDQGDFFHEFVTKCPADAEDVMKLLSDHGILGGLPLSGKHRGEILWCCTEMNSRAEMDEMTELLKEVKKC
jgi:glycine cleavage system pyridoxal-binding protein P